MRYELYVDSLFLMNFVMNLYILILVNRSTLRTATPGRLLAGAIVGGGGYLLPFIIGGPIPFRLLLGAATALGMLPISFPIKGLTNFMKLVEKTLFFSFCIGGGMFFLLRIPGLTGGVRSGTFMALGFGGVLFLFLQRFSEEPKPEQCICRATLIRDGARVTVSALIDSGNSLTEPISGKAVSVVDEKVFKSLWGNGGQGYRAIPYHSIGKKRGILEGYLLPELCIEVNGMSKTFRDVYVAVSPESISVKMIINPRLLTEEKGGSLKKRRNERIYDIKSSDTGKNAV